MNTCPMASAGCKAGCLYTAGRAAFTPSIFVARVNKTVWLHEDRESFVSTLRKNISALVRKATRKGLIPAIRINGTSDLPQLALQMAREFPEVQFYDYTKIPAPWKRTLPNYHLSFSLSEVNLSDAYDALDHGVNVVVVFDTKRGKPLPSTCMGRTVIDGDMHDLRFLDPKTSVIVGVRAKGKAKKDSFGFVQIAPLTMAAKAGL